MPAPDESGQNYLSIPLDFIEANYEFNCRKVDGDTDQYEKIDELKSQIEKEGRLLAPIGVEEIPEDEREGILMYRIIFGFRRFEAVKLLEWSKIQVQVFEPEDEADSYFMNLAENVQRENLTAQEQAVRYHELKHEHDLSGRVIASRIGLTQGHVNNLIRCIEELSPKIIKEWMDHHGMATTDNLIKTILRKEDGEVPSKDVQETRWNKLCGLDDDDDDEEGEETGGNGVRVQSDDPKRATKTHLKRALKALKDCNKDDSFIDGCRKTLKFALGSEDRIPAVYNPAKPPKDEDQDEAQE